MIRPARPSTSRSLLLVACAAAFALACGGSSHPTAGPPSDGAVTTEPPAAPCQPACGGKQCGDDGCGGSCGACPGGASCDASFRCVAAVIPPPACSPSCGTRQCGDDGCGGSCGACAAADACTPQGVCAPRSVNCPAGLWCTYREQVAYDWSCPSGGTWNTCTPGAAMGSFAWHADCESACTPGGASTCNGGRPERPIEDAGCIACKTWCVTIPGPAVRCLDEVPGTTSVDASGVITVRQGCEIDASVGPQPIDCVCM